MGKISTEMNKPVYLGQAILDLSKIIIYEFHYNYIKPKYGNNFRLCYMDTYLLTYNIKTNDFYEDIATDVQFRFDKNGYSKQDNRPLPIGVNKKAVWLKKNELGGKVMTKFVALPPKLYAYKTLSGRGDKKCKGIKKCVLKETLSFNNYKHWLSSTTENAYNKQLMFWNKLHEVHTVEVNKVALSRDDDKRIVQSNCVSMLAH